LARGPGLSPGQRGRWDGQTGGEILLARSHRRVKKELAWITLEVSCF
jgi:hypothetical protein